MAIYIDRFESYGVNLGLPPGFTSRWDAALGVWATVIDGDTALQSVITVPVNTLTSFDRVNGDPDRNNIDVVARVKTNTLVPLTPGMGLAVRASGTALSPTAYIVYTYGSEMRLVKAVAGVITELGVTTGLGLTTGVEYRMRLRANGNSIQARMSLASQSEPAPWTLSATDASITAPGFVGPFTFAAATSSFLDIGAGTNGDTPTVLRGGGAWPRRKLMRRYRQREEDSLGDTTEEDLF